MILRLKKRLICNVFIFFIFTSTSVFAYVEPYLTIIDELSFGELTGFSGTCSLDYQTKELSHVSGTLCPFSDGRKGTPGKFFLFGNPNTQISIRIKNKPNTGDGFSYTPSGVYSVSGFSDVAIISNTFQLVNTGNSGLIIINLGGTFTSAVQQSFNSTFDLVIEDAIQFIEQ